MSKLYVNCIIIHIYFRLSSRHWLYFSDKNSDTFQKYVLLTNKIRLYFKLISTIIPWLITIFCELFTYFSKPKLLCRLKYFYDRQWIQIDFDLYIFFIFIYKTYFSIRLWLTFSFHKFKAHFKSKSNQMFEK